jgi:hypothetical protein
MARFDFPDVETVTECAVRLGLDPSLADVRGRILRIHALYPASVRVVWADHPDAQDRARIDHAWHSMRPGGKVEHLP